MGTSVRSSPSIVVREQRGTNYSKWLSLVLRKRKSTQLNLPSMSMTSREMERLMPSMPEISSVPATRTPPSEPSRKLEVSPRRERRPLPRLKSSPCTRHARTPRTREASMASCPSSPSWKRCALLKSRFSQIRLKRVNKGLQPGTSHIFGESDEPNSQEISRFIKITFRDRGRSIFCYIGFQDMQISIFGGVTEETRKSKGRKPTSSE